jgi:hypothetical protein
MLCVLFCGFRVVHGMCSALSYAGYVFCGLCDTVCSLRIPVICINVVQIFDRHHFTVDIGLSFQFCEALKKRLRVVCVFGFVAYLLQLFVFSVDLP